MQASIFHSFKLACFVKKSNRPISVYGGGIEAVHIQHITWWRDIWQISGWKKIGIAVKFFDLRSGVFSQFKS